MTRALLLGTCAAACRGEGIEGVVWSDDGRARATIFQPWECTDGFLGGESCVDDGPAWLSVDGRRLDTPRPLDVTGSSDLMYMRSAGYVLVPVQVDGWGAELVTTSALDLETGAELWTPDPYSVPSLDGRLVGSAWVEDDGAGGGRLVVQFREGRTGRLEDEATAALAGSDLFLGTRCSRFKWVGEREVRVEVGDGRVMAVEVGGAVTEARAPACWLPRTSSSAWDSEGRNAAVGTNFAGDEEGDLAGGWCPDRWNVW